MSQFLMADISFNIACKRLKIAQITQLNQLFQLLNLVSIYGHGFYELSRMLIRKNVEDSPIGTEWSTIQEVIMPVISNWPSA